MSPSIYIGLISGTSVDAIDVAALRFSETQNPVQLLGTLSYPIPEQIKTSLIALNQNGENEIHQMMSLDMDMGELFSQAALSLLEKYNIAAGEVIAIGSHGQTIRHQITTPPFYTVQIANPNLIAERTQICTVADFRMRDMVVGGQGAPLVPAFHEYVFKSESPRIILNIGGMANITVLDTGKETLGFDTGPGNVLMDAWISHSQEKPYDENGNWAATGEVIPELLNSFLSEAYFNQAPPKSTGRELLDFHWLQKHIEDTQQHAARAEDIQATLLHLSCETIATAIEKWGAQACEIFVCGGGAHNAFFMQTLQNRLRAYRVTSSAELGIEPDWVEACAFAWLAKRCLENKPGNAPGVTGAKKSVVLGGIYPAGY